MPGPYEIPCSVGCPGCSYCCDAYGVDAVKDANAELGNDPYDDEGYYYAQERGWIR